MTKASQSKSTPTLQDLLHDIAIKRKIRQDKLDEELKKEGFVHTQNFVSP